MLSQFTYKNASFSSQNWLKNTPIFHPASSGKEKDSETGYYYFGARYCNPDLSLWLSVDPMADKYPSLSPYNYCAWNPMKIVDPDGAEMDDYQIDKWGKISKCKDQSHAVEGRDRLISKKYGGKVKYDESGNPLNAYVEAAKGTFGSYDHDAKRGMKVTPKEYEDNLGLKHQYTALEIVFNEGSSSENGMKSTEVFEFLSKKTAVEWTVFGLGAPDASSSEPSEYRITSSRMIGYDPHAFSKGKAWGSAVKYAFHPHHNALGASNGDILFQKINPKATMGIFQTWNGRYVDFNGNVIQGPSR